MYIIFVPLNNQNIKEMDIKNTLLEVIHERMKTKRVFQMKDLASELKKMDVYSGVDCAKQFHDHYEEFPNDTRQIDKYIENHVYTVVASADEVIAKGIRYQLGEIAEVLSLSYIARRYFNKSRQWLNQRINGGIVNGKPAKFTEDQLKIFNAALHDISNRIGSVNII